MNFSDHKNNLILIGLVAIIAVGIFFYKSLAKEVTARPSNITESPIAGSTQPLSSEYKNGEYTATGSYVSPGGQEEITVRVVINDDLVRDVVFEPSSGSPTSTFFQEKFMGGFRDMVIGKNINEVRLDHVAGSSLTPIGFNQAIEKIKSQAKS